MEHVLFRKGMTVALADTMGSERDIAVLARVTDPNSVPDGVGPPDDRDKRLLAMLMRDRHGTPWEGVVFRFYVEAPLFVATQFNRHRIASVSAESGRYRELRPVFYLPGPDRDLVQTGRPGAYEYSRGTEDQYTAASDLLMESFVRAYDTYRALLAEGVCREVARTVLPTSLYTSWYLTINLRSLFNLLSLRNATESTSVPTFPQREAEMVARQMEAHARTVVPFAMTLFDSYGRIAP